MRTDRGRKRERREAPVADDQLALSPELAFVVQFRAATGQERDVFAGRVEHVRSGEAARFESRDEFLAWIKRLLALRGRRR
jgi:hypothetical protein